MKTERETGPLHGLFEVEPGRKVSGTLELAGPQLSLLLWDERSFHLGGAGDVINGVLGDTRKVSVWDWSTLGPGFHVSGDTEIVSYSVLPQVVLIGDRELREQGQEIVSISFVMDDLQRLLVDREAFGVIFGKPDLLRALLAAAHPERETEVSNNSRIAYYTGKTEILSCEAGIAEIAVLHRPGLNWAKADGVRIDNTIIVSIRFRDCVSVTAATSFMRSVVSFFEIVLGRSRNLLGVWAELDGELELVTGERAAAASPVVTVHESRFGMGERSKHGIEPRQMLVDPVRSSAEFASVLAGWLEMEDERRVARWTFRRCWEEAGVYGPDRAIRAANMFDLLPSETFLETETVSTLGRVGKISLKRRIRQRVALLEDRLNDWLPDLSLVTDAAVNQRNLYVHGEQSGKPVRDDPGLSVFLTNTLEFVFAVSELVEAGWRVEDWLDGVDWMGHPVSQYVYSYKRNLAALRKSMEA